MSLKERRCGTGSLAALLFFFSIGFVGGCSTKKDPPAPVDAGKRATTSANIAVANFIDDVDARLARNSPRPSDRLKLVDMLLDRSHYLGKISDLDLADARSRDDGDAGPPSPESHLMRARFLGAVHKFDDAIKELDLAKAANADGRRIAAARASIHMARGEYDEALALQLPQIETRDAISIATAAVLAAKMNKPDSDRLFDAARAKYTDISPFPLAWMDFQRGSIEALAGDDAPAEKHFAEAVELLPVYAHALVHLAPSLPPPEAVAKLEQVRKLSDDPEVLVALASAKQRAGQPTADLIERAKKRYEEIVAKYPEAFADHAARFWLGPGNDPKKALELAKLNAKNRPNEEALDLWMATAAGARENAEVCAAANAMSKLKYLSKRGSMTATAARTKCPD
jgi:tetratricopeptide (TPR) repeat protein